MWVGGSGMCITEPCLCVTRNRKENLDLRKQSILSMDCKVFIDVLRFADKKFRVYLAPLEHRSDERIPFL
jgi:hypothetical protein